jgi:hypothetical protein
MGTDEVRSTAVALVVLEAGAPAVVDELSQIPLDEATRVLDGMTGAMLLVTVTEAPIEEAPIEEAPTEEAPIEEALAEEALTEPEGVAGASEEAMLLLGRTPLGRRDETGALETPGVDSMLEAAGVLTTGVEVSETDEADEVEA